MCCFVVFQRENGVGDGSSLLYPPVVVDVIRHLYPGDIKDYVPKSRKVGKMRILEMWFREHASNYAQ